MWTGICPRSFVVVEYIIMVTISKFHISSYSGEVGRVHVSCTFSL